jgi:hypothetical protein
MQIGSNVVRDSGDSSDIKTHERSDPIAFFLETRARSLIIAFIVKAIIVLLSVGVLASIAFSDDLKLNPPEPEPLRVTYNQEFSLGGFGFSILKVEALTKIMRGGETLRTPLGERAVMVTFGFWSLSNRPCERGDAGEVQIIDDSDNLYKPDADVDQFLGLDWLDTLKPGMKYMQRQVFLLPTEVSESHFTIQIPERGQYVNGNNLAYMVVNFSR